MSGMTKESLFSAAPQLLESLEAVIDFLDSAHDGTLTTSPKAFQEWTEKAVAAIALAKGEMQ